MFLKLMSDENIPDSDTRKSYRLLARVDAVHFNRSPEAPEPSHNARAYVTFEGGEREEFDLVGNAYVMNDTGKTIEKFGIHPLVPGEYPAKA